MTGGKGENRGVKRGVVEVVTFTLKDCEACIILKDTLRTNEIPFRNMIVGDKLGPILEQEYLTEHYPIVAIIDKETKMPYWVFVTESSLDDPKIIHWNTMNELIIKIKNKYNALQTTNFE